MRKVKIGDWEVCCNDMLDALLEDAITATNPNTEELLLLVGGAGNHITYCPWCGKKIETPELVQ